MENETKTETETVPTPAPLPGCTAEQAERIGFREIGVRGQHRFYWCRDRAPREGPSFLDSALGYLKTAGSKVLNFERFVRWEGEKETGTAVQYWSIKTMAK